MELKQKEVLVIGLGLSGVAASQLLVRKGASVCAVDNFDTENLRREAVQLQAIDVDVRLGVSNPPDQRFDLVVTSPGVPWDNPILAAMVKREAPIIGELELAAQNARCLTIAISGTNGKTTTTELVERVLLADGRRTVAA